MKQAAHRHKNDELSSFFSEPINQDHLNFMLIWSGDPAVGLKLIFGGFVFNSLSSSLSAVHPQGFGRKKRFSDGGQSDENRWLWPGQGSPPDWLLQENHQRECLRGYFQESVFLFSHIE